jgi:hypothetical protein
MKRKRGKVFKSAGLTPEKEDYFEPFLLTPFSGVILTA